MKKYIFASVIAFLFLGFSANTNAFESQSNNVKAVLDKAWDDYGLLSYQIGITDPIITIAMDEMKSEKELRKYLNENLSKSDLNKYDIEIFEKNIKELKEEHLKQL